MAREICEGGFVFIPNIRELILFYQTRKNTMAALNLTLKTTHQRMVRKPFEYRRFLDVMFQAQTPVFMLYLRLSERAGPNFKRFIFSDDGLKKYLTFRFLFK